MSNTQTPKTIDLTEATQEEQTTMNNPKNLSVTDTTVSETDAWRNIVIVHDFYGEPSIICYVWGLADAIKELSGESVGELLPEHEPLPEGYVEAWISGEDKGKLDGYAYDTELRIEYFEDFLKDYPGEWAELDGSPVKGRAYLGPSWW